MTENVKIQVWFENMFFYIQNLRLICFWTGVFYHLFYKDNKVINLFMPSIQVFKNFPWWGIVLSWFDIWHLTSQIFSLHNHQNVPGQIVLKQVCLGTMGPVPGFCRTGLSNFVASSAYTFPLSGLVVSSGLCSPPDWDVQVYLVSSVKGILNNFVSTYLFRAPWCCGCRSLLE